MIHRPGAAMEASACHAPGRQQYNPIVDDIRDSEYPMLNGKCYLDHAGTTIYARSLIDAVSKDLLSNLYGNPHSDSTPSAVSGRRVDEVRLKTLRFFKADPEHFDLIFVANASAAVKLVMECFRDYSASSKGCSRGFWYGYHRDCHTSLVGVREATKGAQHCFHNDTDVENWIAGRTKSLKRKSRGPRRGQIGLFAYPGQSNMTGRRLPLSWPGRVRTSTHFSGPVYTLLDAAALATTAPLDYSDESSAPDFTCLSFYKIFGFPDLGALIVRKATANILQERRAFFGGTVDMVIALSDIWHAKKDNSLHDQLEDGTLPFHSIIALDYALDVHQRLFGSMSQISAHTAFLVKKLHDGLVSLRHFNGQPVCKIYNDASAVYGDPLTQGATVALNILRSDGSHVGYADVEKLADKEGIYVRSGSLCNPGGFATYLSWPAWQMRAAYDAGHRCSDPTQLVYGKPTGVVRVSLGPMSNHADVDRWLAFVKDHYVEGTYETLLPILDGSQCKSRETSLADQQPTSGITSWPLANLKLVGGSDSSPERKVKRRPTLLAGFLAFRTKGQTVQKLDIHQVHM